MYNVAVKRHAEQVETRAKEINTLETKCVALQTLLRKERAAEAERAKHRLEAGVHAEALTQAAAERDHLLAQLEDSRKR